MEELTRKEMLILADQLYQDGVYKSFTIALDQLMIKEQGPMISVMLTTGSKIITLYYHSNVVSLYQMTCTEVKLLFSNIE